MSIFIQFKNECGYLSYIDVSIGKKVAGFSTAHGRCDLMTQNPSNAVIHLGHSSGTVTLWSPNMKEPLAKMLCHKSGVRSLAINQAGNYMVTSGLDHLLNVWDMRTFRQLKSVKLSSGASGLAFSQKNMIGASLKNEVVVIGSDLLKTGKQFGEFSDEEKEEPEEEQYIEDFNERNFYLKYRLNNTYVQNLQFCPFEDVLGIGHGTGISSILVPGK
jgi:U3 small nucleolar RNA-associated protein 7